MGLVPYQLLDAPAIPSPGRNSTRTLPSWGLRASRAPAAPPDPVRARASATQRGRAPCHSAQFGHLLPGIISLGRQLCRQQSPLAPVVGFPRLALIVLCRRIGLAQFLCMHSDALHGCHAYHYIHLFAEYGARCVKLFVIRKRACAVSETMLRLASFRCGLLDGRDVSMLQHSFLHALEIPTKANLRVHSLHLASVGGVSLPPVRAGAQVFLMESGTHPRIPALCSASENPHLSLLPHNSEGWQTPTPNANHPNHYEAIPRNTARLHGRAAVRMRQTRERRSPSPVSYTHLTLPTIYSV